MLGGIFSGASKQPKFIYNSITPPLPIRNNFYRCDKRFWTELIEPLFEDHATIGAVIVLGETEQMYKIKGTQITKVHANKLNRQKAQKKGGQSAPRIQRIQKSQVKHYVNYVCEQITQNFWDGEANKANVKFIVLSGAEHLCKQISAILSHYPIVQPSIYMDNIKSIMEWSGSALSSTEDAELITEINTLFERMEGLDPLIMYGEEEITTQSYRIKKLYTTRKRVDLPDIEQIVVGKESVSGSKLETVGGMIAVAYY